MGESEELPHGRRVGDRVAHRAEAPEGLPIALVGVGIGRGHHLAEQVCPTAATEPEDLPLHVLGRPATAPTGARAVVARGAPRPGRATRGVALLGPSALHPQPRRRPLGHRLVGATLTLGRLGCTKGPEPSLTRTIAVRAPGGHASGDAARRSGPTRRPSIRAPDPLDPRAAPPRRTGARRNGRRNEPYPERTGDRRPAPGRTIPDATIPDATEARLALTRGPRTLGPEACGGAPRRFTFTRESPAATYSPRESPPKYHRRWRSSLPCSEWERVFPRRYCHRNILCCQSVSSPTSHETPRRQSVRTPERARDITDGTAEAAGEQEDPKPSAD